MIQPPGFPDFFVVGAPRCGTTSLCRFLKKNPQVRFSRPKEPHYFSRISALPTADQLQTQYIDHYFGSLSAGHRVTGEGSVSYLYSAQAIDRILHFNPAARFIVMVRNPLSMLPSYHLKMRFLLLEDETDFAKAWSLQEARARGERVPRICHDASLLMYAEVARYGRQIERLFQMASRDRVHVIVFEDFLADPMAMYRGVLEFLGVDYDGRTWFLPRNESRMYRFRWLQRLLRLPAAYGRGRANNAGRAARKHKRGRLKAGKWINSLVEWNWVPVTPTPLTGEIRAIVAGHLRSDVDLLSRLLGRDMGFWLAEAD